METNSSSPCGVCGAAWPNDVLFCPKCGERRRSSEPMSTPEPLHAPELVSAVPGESTGVQKLRDIMKEKVLDANKTDVPENFLWRGGYSPKAMLGGWILSLIVTVVACTLVAIFKLGSAGWFIAIVISLAVWGGHLIMLIYQRMNFEYELTTQRFIHRYGVFNRVTNRIELIDVSDVQVTQTFVERFLKVGTIKVLSTDTSDPLLVMNGIDDVNRIATLIDDTRRTERRKRSVHIETS